MKLSPREINIRFPWLKIVMMIGVGLVLVFGTLGLLRHDLTDNRVEMPVAETILDVTPELEHEENDVIVVEEHETEVEQEATKEKVEDEQNKRELAGKKLVVLTFDDGPSKQTTARLLDILKEKKVKANFFLIGQMAERSPELLRRELDEGHEVGSHTVTHVNLARSTVEAIKWEETRMDEIFRDLAGSEVKLMRPPYGAVNEQVRANVLRPMVLWSVDPEDWKYKNIAEVVRRVDGAVFDGAIVLMHDIYATTVDAVPTIIDDLRAMGYEFVTVTELAGIRGVPLEQGRTYGSFRL